MATKSSPSIIKNMLEAGTSLTVFAVVTTAIVALTYVMSKSQIEENHRLSLLRNLHELVPTEQHDNDMYVDTLSLNEATLNYRGKPIDVYRARSDGKPVAAIFGVTAPDGYTGAINLLVAINIDNSLAGVRVISHLETPGLGDAIETDKSDWVLQFDGRSFSNPPLKKWKVRKDGGKFDQLTGATITPRAIVKITKKTLAYFQANHDIVFSMEEKENKKAETGK